MCACSSDPQPTNQSIMVMCTNCGKDARWHCEKCQANHCDSCNTVYHASTRSSTHHRELLHNDHTAQPLMPPPSPPPPHHHPVQPQLIQTFAPLVLLPSLASAAVPSATSTSLEPVDDHGWGNHYDDDPVLSTSRTSVTSSDRVTMANGASTSTNHIHDHTTSVTLGTGNYNNPRSLPANTIDTDRKRNGHAHGHHDPSTTSTTTKPLSIEKKQSATTSARNSNGNGNGHYASRTMVTVSTANQFHSLLLHQYSQLRMKLDRNIKSSTFDILQDEDDIVRENAQDRLVGVTMDGKQWSQWTLGLAPHLQYDSYWFQKHIVKYGSTHLPDEWGVYEMKAVHTCDNKQMVIYAGRAQGASVSLRSRIFTYINGGSHVCSELRRFLDADYLIYFRWLIADDQQQAILYEKILLQTFDYALNKEANGERRILIPIDESPHHRLLELKEGKKTEEEAHTLVQQRLLHTKLDGRLYGRDKLMNKLMTWINDRKTNQRLLVIKGSAGLGKSAISAELIRRLKHTDSTHLLLGHHICDYSQEHSPNVLRLFFNTLISNLPNDLKGAGLNYFPGMSLITIVDHIKTRSRSAAAKGAYVLVIDGLDESPQIASLMTQQLLESLPSWLRIIVSTRPTATMNWTDSCRQSHVIDLNTLEDQVSAVRTYVIEHLSLRDTSTASATTTTTRTVGDSNEIKRSDDGDIDDSDDDLLAPTSDDDAYGDKLVTIISNHVPAVKGVELILEYLGFGAHAFGFVQRLLLDQVADASGTSFIYARMLMEDICRRHSTFRFDEIYRTSPAGDINEYYRVTFQRHWPLDSKNNNRPPASYDAVRAVAETIFCRIRLSSVGPDRYPLQTQLYCATLDGKCNYDEAKAAMMMLEPFFIRYRNDLDTVYIEPIHKSFIDWITRTNDHEYHNPYKINLVNGIRRVTISRFIAQLAGDSQWHSLELLPLKHILLDLLGVGDVTSRLHLQLHDDDKYLIRIFGEEQKRVHDLIQLACAIKIRLVPELIYQLELHRMERGRGGWWSNEQLDEAFVYVYTSGQCEVKGVWLAMMPRRIQCTHNFSYNSESGDTQPSLSRGESINENYGFNSYQIDVDGPDARDDTWCVF